MNNNQTLVFFHLYNDFSGSPTILRTFVKGCINRGLPVELVTSRGGILDSLGEHPNYKRYSFYYKFSIFKSLTLLRFLWAQLYMFCFAFRYAFRPNVVFYINTILPVAPALAGRIMGKRIVYHYHENAWMKGRVYKELSRVMTWLADEIICVSDYQRSMLRKKKHTHVVPNAVSDTFRAKLQADAARAFSSQTILMASSPRLYKGIAEFLQLAACLPQYHFVLILNLCSKQKDKFLRKNHLQPTENVTVHSRSNNMPDHYNKASIVVNLSQSDAFVETYGLTIAEGLCAGLPCIVPEIGGVKELVQHGITGYHTSCYRLDEMAQQIDGMLSNKELYCSMAKAALESSQFFSEGQMVNNILQIINRK